MVRRESVRLYWRNGAGRPGGLLAGLFTLGILFAGGGCGPNNSGGGDNDNVNGNGSDAGADATSGCSANADCAATPDRPYCSEDGECVACVEGDPTRGCSGVLVCCGTTCIDAQYDDNNCGGCGTVCELPNATSVCSAGACIIETCASGYEDCDMDAENGCEMTTAGGGCACDPGTSESCYSGPPGTENVGACSPGLRTCNAEGTGYGPCEGEVLPAADDCTNTVDDDCDGIVNNGFPTGADCNCLPGAVESCYNGPAGTEGVGTCASGTWTCNTDGTGFGFCVGEVLPAAEVCNNGVDEDCNGVPDDSLDQDGDGWTVCDGDCCDVAGPVCGDPALVNVGAFEVAGNGVDDDCDGVIDNPLPACDSGLASNSNTAIHYARAIDLCQNTVESPPLTSRNWGVISAQLLLASGAGSPNGNQRSIRSGFGSNVVTQAGVSLAVLSTGHAADTSDLNPNYSPFQGGTDMGTSSAAPADWLAANGGTFPNAPGCPGPWNGSVTANNPIMLKLRIRVPTNAQSFSVSTYFYSSEYPEFVCSSWNDFFVVLLDSVFSGSPANPADKNLALYSAGAVDYPVGVNLAFGNTGLFKQCLNGPTGCANGAIPGTATSCQNTNELTGTGFDVLNPPPQFAGDPGWCGTSNFSGGGTGWLTTSGNVAPGETIELRFAVWDVGDQWYDSLILLDNFQWSINASTPGTTD